MQDSLQRLVYISDRDHDVECDMTRLLASANEFNMARNIKGALWFDGNHFLQVLEGREGILEKVLQRIRQSKEHTDIDIVYHRAINTRYYQDWTMSYFGSFGYNRRVVEDFAGGSTPCLRELPYQTLVDMVAFLEDERRNNLLKSI